MLHPLRAREARNAGVRFMEHVRPWLRAVLRHWKQELLGGALIALLGLISEITGVSFPPRIYEIAAVLVLIYAMFLAFADEHAGRLKAEGKLLISRPALSPEAQIIAENTAALREQVMHRRFDQTREMIRNVSEASEQKLQSQKVAKLVTFSKRGKELFDMTISQNLESWKLTVEGWHRDVMATLNASESIIFDAPIANNLEAIGHAGALNRVHGDLRGRLLVWLERLSNIAERYNV